MEPNVKHTPGPCVHTGKELWRRGRRKRRRLATPKSCVLPPRWTQGGSYYHYCVSRLGVVSGTTTHCGVKG